MFNFNILAGYSPEFLHKTKEIQFNLARERYPRVNLDEVSEIDAYDDNYVAYWFFFESFAKLKTIQEQ